VLPTPEQATPRTVRPANTTRRRRLMPRGVRSGGESNSFAQRSLDPLQEHDSFSVISFLSAEA
jgi:hypothetical protein